MSDELENIFNIVSTHKNLVSQFTRLLEEAGTKVETFSHGKYFRATKKESSVFILAHESTKDGWWGLARNHVEILTKAVKNPDNKLIGWGVALMDKSPKRGYWIRGEDIVELQTLRVARLNRSDQFQFHLEDLQSHPGLATYFVNIGEFLLLTRLNVEG